VAEIPADEPIVPKGAYSVDVNKFDDPDFNPFETKKAMSNSPIPNEEPIAPKGAYSVDFDKFDDPNFNPFETKKAMSNSPTNIPECKPVVPVNEAPTDEIMNELETGFEPPKRAPPKLGANRKKVVKKPVAKKPVVKPAPVQELVSHF
jgi:hypothetical protein